MATYTYTRIEPKSTPPYVMLQVDTPPGNFSDVHVTIPKDDPTGAPVAIADIMWKFPHVTYVWSSSGQQKKLHCFLKQIKGKYEPFDSSNKRMNLDAKFSVSFYIIARDQFITDVLFDESTF